MMKTRHRSIPLAAMGLVVSAGPAFAATSDEFDVQRARMGDLNGDGVVDVGDLGILLKNYGAVDAGPMHGDLNGDGVVDREDVRILLSMFGQAVDDEAVVAELARAGLLVDVEPNPGGGSPWGTHHPVISNAQHSQAFSQSHPNHDQTISNGWPNWPAGHNPALSEVWPPNHLSDVSENWPQGHDKDLSAPWPPSHKPDISVHNPAEPWTWPPPGEHNPALSITWPPAHSFMLSPNQPPNQWTLHHEEITATWPGGQHGHDWPANHYWTVSQYWTNHNGALSKTWPPNHFMLITLSWGQNNHAIAQSRSWPPNYHQQANSANAGVHAQRESGLIVIDVEVIDPYVDVQN